MADVQSTTDVKVYDPITIIKVGPYLGSPNGFMDELYDEKNTPTHYIKI
jgi:hypothetical protein